jgi:diacylglycerol kinase family enzyme
MGFIAKVVHRANESKSWAGSSSYIVGALKTFFGGEPPDTYKCETYVDNELVHETLQSSMLFMVMNGKFGGGGLPFAPCAFMNDGLMDFTYSKKENIGTYDIPGIFNKIVMSKGIHIYDPEWVSIRGDKIVIKNV